MFDNVLDRDIALVNFVESDDLEQAGMELIGAITATDFEDRGDFDAGALAITFLVLDQPTEAAIIGISTEGPKGMSSLVLQCVNAGMSGADARGALIASAPAVRKLQAERDAA